ncbi:uncharacterized protein LTHEOB_43 [Lasiodiplodia theobromae]|uniref:uncharacterized protein n=1 Tax=Lasiodiplodia theobromae TaxID=45133 RepID=UPI0015C315AA|nr:uncharacterized protein LTHEOB_43 [Lasiodiplodia theobromae]KAF4543344.1 hypothetical protein LTHEOB_43 [Lasiodiplodia theobromae]
MSPTFSKQIEWLQGMWPPNWRGSYTRAAGEEQPLAHDRPWHEDNMERGPETPDAGTKLEGSYEDAAPVVQQHQQRRRWRSKWQHAWRLLVVLLALWGTFDLCHRAARPLLSRLAHPHISDASFWCRKACPQIADEARALGCVFDELENRFTKPECINADITDEFTRAGPGPDGAWFYRTEIDGNMTTVNVSQVIDLIEPGRMVWQTTRWHLLHCMFVWRKISLSRFDGTLLPMNREEEATHGKHCERLVASFLVGGEMDEYLAHTEY